MPQSNTFASLLLIPIAGFSACIASCLGASRLFACVQGQSRLRSGGASHALAVPAAGASLGSGLASTGFGASSSADADPTRPASPPVQAAVAACAARAAARGVPRQGQGVREGGRSPSKRMRHDQR